AASPAWRGARRWAGRSAWRWSAPTWPGSGRGSRFEAATADPSRPRSPRCRSTTRGMSGRNDRPWSDSTMSEPARRRSPVHQLLGSQGAQWGQLAGAPVVLHVGVINEAAFLPVLALCDVSALPKVGVKGPGAEAWLGGQ